MKPLIFLLSIIAGVATGAIPNNITRYDNFLFRFFRHFDSVRNNLSRSCVESYEYFLKHQHDDWARIMIDANAAEEPGRAIGNLQFLGEFDECIGIRMPAKAPIHDRNIQYCSVHFPPEMVLYQEEIDNFDPVLLAVWPPMAGICLPAACSARDDLPIILQRVSEDIHVADCTTESQLAVTNRLQPVHMAIGSAILVLVVLIALATVVESFLVSNNHWLFRFLHCFSLRRNLSVLFQTRPYTVSASVLGGGKGTQSTSGRPRTPQIDCLHGVRSLSIIFVLTFHVMTEAMVPCANFLVFAESRFGFLLQLVTNATAWVDTYLLLAGFVLAHSWLHQQQDSMPPTSSFWQTIAAYLKRLWHRYIRLTPSVAGILGLSILIEVLGSGPFWHKYVQLSSQSCHRNWWGVLLYVNNFFNLNTATEPQRECLSYLWYLAVDMQCFILSPLLLAFLAHPCRRKQRIGVTINLVFILGSIVITGILIVWKRMPPTILMNVYDLQDYINLVYKATYCRIGPYCIGILLAHFLRQHQLKWQHRRLMTADPAIEPEHEHIDDDPDNKNMATGNRKTGLMLLVAAMAMIFGSMMLTYWWLQGAPYDNVPATIYGAVYRSVWSLGWALLIWAMVRHHLPLLDRIFSHPLCQLTSKLSYQNYLVHSVIISAVVDSTRRTLYFSNFSFALTVIRYFFFAQMVSIVTFVLFERPFINLESMITGSQRSGQQQQRQRQQPLPR